MRGCFCLLEGVSAARNRPVCALIQVSAQLAVLVSGRCPGAARQRFPALRRI